MFTLNPSPIQKSVGEPDAKSRLFLLVLKQFLLGFVLTQFLLGSVLAWILPGLVLAQFAD